jgi:hypothetical protein
MKFQPSLPTLTLFAVFAHTGLAWTDKGWVTTYSYATGSDCSGEVLAISSEYEEWNNECVSVSNLYNAYETMEYRGAKLQCTGSNQMIVKNYEERWDCDTQVGSSRIIHSGECQVDNEGRPYKIFFNCWTGSKHDYSSVEPKNKVQITVQWHDESTCSGDAIHFDGASRGDSVLKQDYCYKAGDSDDTWQNSYKITCDGDKAIGHQYETSDCSDEPREIDTIEDFCQEYGSGGTRFLKVDVICGNESMFDQALGWLKEQAENLGISQEALVGIVGLAGSMGSLSIALLVYRCCCRGSKRGPLSLV